LPGLRAGCLGAWVLEARAGGWCWGRPRELRTRRPNWIPPD